MKKALSLIMALMMLFALSTNAFATNFDIVGSVNGNGPAGAHKGNVNDGLTSIPVDSNASTSVAITATAGDVEHRYAVDIVYQEMNLTITGSKLVWNVNTLQYENKEGSTAVTDQDFDVTVTNYSDMPVKLSAALTAGDKAADLNLNLSEGTELDKTAANDTFVTTIDAATIGNKQDKSFNLTAWSTDWEAVSNHYLKVITGSESVTIATLKITISAP